MIDFNDWEWEEDDPDVYVVFYHMVIEKNMMGKVMNGNVYTLYKNGDGNFFTKGRYSSLEKTQIKRGLNLGMKVGYRQGKPFTYVSENTLKKMCKELGISINDIKTKK